MSIKEKLAADIWYVDNISLKIDIKILIKTVIVVFKKTGASITENGIQNELEELKQMHMKRLVLEKNTNIYEEKIS